MRTSDTDILFVSGSPKPADAEHWQERWGGRLSTARQVAPAPAERGSAKAWVDALGEQVAAATLPVVLVAHGLGVLVVAQAAPTFPPDRVRGAFLVAPPSASRDAKGVDPAFADISTAPLPFPSVLVASRTDSMSDFGASEDLSYAWGSAFVDAGDAGRLDSASGHGPWPEGLMRFASFLSKL